VANWDDQGKQYAAFIDAQLKAENDRRDSVNSRAGTALTGAAGLVTLVLAVFAVFVGKDFVLTGFARKSLGFALLMLLLAAVSAVLAGYPWRSKIISPESLDIFLTARWTNTETLARNVTSRANVEAITTLRRGTSIKFFFLMIAGALQVLAVVGLVACTLAVIRVAPTKPVQPVTQPTSIPTCCPATCATGSSTAAPTTPPATSRRG
jgi:hypothetical protein